MRIISGSARGRRLFTPRDSRVRPTSDRVKEALFNILTGFLGTFDGLAVLDIFAGTGNLGIEALSRGANSATFIDNHRESAALVKRNLEACGFADRGRVIVKEAASALKMLEREGERFHLAFLDPPYRQGLAAEVLEYLSASALLDENSLVIAEFSAKEEMPGSFGALQEVDRRTYGDTALSFLKLFIHDAGLQRQI